MTENHTHELEGGVVVITGAARGMGRAYVEGFMNTGAKVVATDKSWSGMDEFRREIEAEDGLVLEMDVTDEDQIDEAYRATIDTYGTTDVVINNAALLQMALYEQPGRVTTLETSDEDWDRMLDVNVRGPLRVIRRFIQPMIEGKNGTILNVVSSGILSFSFGSAYTALRPISKEMPYMATKAALATMSFYLAEEVKQHGISVNTLIPGHTRASWYDDWARTLIDEGKDPGPPPVVPEHIVPVATFLASEDAKEITGKMFDVLEWNLDHGYGGLEEWMDLSLPDDILEEMDLEPDIGNHSDAALRFLP